MVLYGCTWLMGYSVLIIYLILIYLHSDWLLVDCCLIGFGVLLFCCEFCWVCGWILSFVNLSYELIVDVLY